MPYVNEQPHTPKEAVAKGFCPECGKDLKLTTADLEVSIHWPKGFDDPANMAEAIARAQMIRDFFDGKLGVL